MQAVLPLLLFGCSIGGKAVMHGTVYFGDVVIFHRVSAPADALLAAGDCALWLDDTDGAAKLMIKAKSANGTVRTGSVNLS